MLDPPDAARQERGIHTRNKSAYTSPAWATDHMFKYIWSCDDWRAGFEGFGRKTSLGYGEPAAVVFRGSGPVSIADRGE